MDYYLFHLQFYQGIVSRDIDVTYILLLIIGCSNCIHILMKYHECVSIEDATIKQSILMVIKELGGKLKFDKNKAVVSVELWSKRKVTDADLLHLKGMTDLKQLVLLGTTVTDAGLAHLKGLKKLENLNLAATKVTDAGLVHLKGLTNLTTLSLADTAVTDAGVKQLQQALPNCKISH